MGFGVVISRVISPLIRVISIVTRLISLLIITHEPPSEGGCRLDFWSWALESFLNNFNKGA